MNRGGVAWGTWGTALALALVSLLAPAAAETVAQLNGASSVVETQPTHDFSSGVLSCTVWAYPERKSGEEALASFAQSDLLKSATLGWSAGKFYYRDDHSGVVETNKTYDRKEWHHAAMVATVEDLGVYSDASGTQPAHRRVKIYVDGEEQIDLVTVMPDLSTAVFTVGSEHRGGQRRAHFKGSVDEARAYASELSAAQVAELPFEKPPSGTKIRVDFEAVAAEDLSSSTKEVGGIKYSHLDPTSVGQMPYDAISLASVSKVSPFSNDLYTNYEGPASGLTVTVTGANFANTPFLQVTLDGVKADFAYSSSTELLVEMPSYLGDLEANEGKKKVVVTNGGKNEVTFDFTFAYNVVEDLNRDLAAHYNLDGNTECADRDHSANDATNANTYQGKATFVADRNEEANRALEFKYGQKLEVPTAVGSGSDFTVCEWVYLVPGNHTIYAERETHASATKTKTNEIGVGSDGVITFRGQASGSAIVFDAWQFVCVAVGPSGASVYRAGAKVASLGGLKTEGSGSLVAQIAGHVSGKVDDAWLWRRELSAEEVAKVYDKDTFSVHLDGSRHFELTNDASRTEFDSAKWHTDSEVTAEVWVKPSSVTGTRRLLKQPSKKNGATGDAALGFVVSIIDGRIEFRVMLDSDLPYFRAVATSEAVIVAGAWQLVSVTYDQSSIIIAVNGVAQKIGVSSFLTGSLTVTEPYVTKYTFLTIISDPTSLDKQPMETSTKTMLVGESLEGELGDVRLWSRDLAEAEILATYDCRPHVGSSPNLYAYFSLDVGMGSALSSGNAPDLALTFTGPKDPFWTLSDRGLASKPIHWPNSPVTGSGTVSASANATAGFTLQAKDKCGSLLNRGGDNVQVAAAGPLDTHAKLFLGSSVDNLDGTYTGSYVAQLCGFYALRVEDSTVPVEDGTYLNGTFDSKLAKDTPIKVFVKAGPTDAATTYAFDSNDLTPNNDDRAKAVAGRRTSFELQTLDLFGCIKKSGGDLFEASLTGAYAEEGVVVDNQDGTYAVEYMPLTPGRALLSVTLNGEHVGTSAVGGVLGSKIEHDTNTVNGLVFGYEGGQGSPFCVEAGEGGSLEFDGQSHVEVSDSDALDLPLAFTIDLWVKPKQAALDAKLLSKESPLTGRGYFLSLESGLASFSVYVGNEEYRYLQTSFAPEVGKWTHLTASYNGSELSVLADAKVVGAKVYEESRAARQNRQKLVMGNGLVGLLDEVRFREGALGKEEISQTMACPSASSKVDAYYRMNDAFGSFVADSSASRADGSLGGDPKPTFVSDQAPSDAGTLDLDASSFSGAGLAGATVGQEGAFDVVLVDRCGLPYNKVLGGEGLVPPSLVSATFEATPQGDAVRPHDNLDELPVASVTAQAHPCFGTNAFRVAYNATSCGVSTLRVAVEGQDVRVYSVAVSSDGVTDPSRTVLDFPAEVTTGIEFEAKISTFDRFGCRRTTGGDAADAALTRMGKPAEEGTMHGGDAYVSVLSVEDRGDGTYLARAVAPGPGSYRLDAAVGGVAASEPAVPVVSASPPDLRKVLDSGLGSLYNTIITQRNGDVYVLDGWDEGKEFRSGVQRYEPGADDETFTYRAKFTLSKVPSHAIAVIVDTQSKIREGKMSKDCRDLQFRSASTGATIPHWVDPLQGCGSALGTSVWLDPAEKEFYAYYGNPRATSSALATPEALVVSFDDFEASRGTKAHHHGYALAQPCGQCSLSLDQDAAAFGVTQEVALHGTGSLKCNAMSTVGGAIEKRLGPLQSYRAKAFLYVSGAGDPTTAINWFSPNYDPCHQGGSAGEGNGLCSQGFSLGFNSKVSRDNFSSSYPWMSTAAAAGEGWHSFEVLDDGEEATFAIDGVVLPDLSRPSVPLDRVLLSAGGGSVGAWDSVLVARHDGGITAAEGAEEAVVSNGRSFFPVSSRGGRPPFRRTTSHATLGSKVYLAGGFGMYAAEGPVPSYGAVGEHAAEDKVWSYDLERHRWESQEPYGSLRPVAREFHTVSGWDSQDSKRIYVFGGMSGGGVLGDHLAFDLEEGAWRRLDAEGPGPRYGHVSASFAGSYYIFGGVTAAGEHSKELWRFDCEGEYWQEVTPASEAPSSSLHAAHCVGGDSWFVLSADGSLKRYDFHYNEWSAVTFGSGYDQSLLGASCTFAGGELYVYGGKRTNDFSSDFFRLSV